MHTHHVVYRDLKPENVMFDTTGFAKVGSLQPLEARCTPKPISHAIVFVVLWLPVDRLWLCEGGH